MPNKHSQTSTNIQGNSVETDSTDHPTRKNIRVNNKHNRISKLFGINYPIIQGGMVYCSGAQLAGAVSKYGGLGLLGAGSMSVDILKSQIQKAKAITGNPIGINLPLLYSKVEDQIQIALDANIRIFFTSAGSPKKYTAMLQQNGCVVAHVTSTPDLATKCAAAGVNAVVAEGFEAGGHNGRDEITTMALIPQVVHALSKYNLPVIAAGGVASGGAIAAVFALGAEGAQLGSRFVATQESSAHQDFKDSITAMRSSDTMLCMKNLVPVRLFKNAFYKKIAAAEKAGATPEDLKDILGAGKARLGMLDGDMEFGELEIGQVSGLIHDIPTVATLMDRLRKEYEVATARIVPNL